MKSILSNYEIPQGWLGDIQTCGMILASAYILYYLTAT